MLKRFRSLLRVLTRRRDFEAGMAEELRFHLEQYAADLTRSGVPPEEAARRARLEFGGLNSVKGDCRARFRHRFSIHSGIAETNLTKTAC